MATSVETQIEDTAQSTETPTEPTPNASVQSSSGDAPGTMSAVVIGGTGAVGRCLVGVLLRDKVSSKSCFTQSNLTIVLYVYKVLHIY